MLIGDAVVIITGILSALIDQTSKNHTFSSRGSLYNKIIIYIYLCSLQALVLGFAVLVQVAIVGQWFYGEPPVVVQVPQSAGQNSTMSCCKTPVGQIVASLGYNKTCKILSLLSPISLLSWKGNKFRDGKEVEKGFFSSGIRARCWSRLLVWRFGRAGSATTTGRRRSSASPSVCRFRFGCRARSARWQPRRRATGRLGSPTAYWPPPFSSSWPCSCPRVDSWPPSAERRPRRWSATGTTRSARFLAAVTRPPSSTSNRQKPLWRERCITIAAVRLQYANYLSAFFTTIKSSWPACWTPERSILMLEYWC